MKRAFLFIALLALLAPPAAMALCPAPEPRTCSAYFRSDKVYVGHITAKVPLREDGRVATGDDFVDRHRYTLRVERHFKGRVGPVEHVTSENASARWVADVGDRRVVFARQGEVWDLCSPIDEARNIGRTLAEIGALAKARHATIEGEVLDEQFEPMAGRYLTAFGHGTTYSAVTDRLGRFRMAVPPGDYSLETRGLHETFPESRTDSSAFTVRRGECAQFRFSTRKVFEPVPPPEWPDDITTQPSLARPAARGLRLGAFRVKLGETPLSSIVKAAPRGHIEHQGQQGTSLHWVCYSSIRRTHTHRIWIASTVMGGPERAAMQVMASRLEAGTQEAPGCPQPPKKLDAPRLDNGLWLGATRAEVRRKLGDASEMKGATAIYHHEKEIGGGTFVNVLELAFEGDRVASLRVSQVWSS